MKFKGIPASPGIAIGRAYLVNEESYMVIKRNIRADQIKKEISRFKKAVARTETEFKRQRIKVVDEMGKDYARLFDAYMLILKDPLLYKDTMKIIAEETVNVEYALQKVIDRITKTFSLLDDEYMRDRIRDVQDVGNKIMMDLTGNANVNLKDIHNRVALVAHTLHPSDMVEMKKENIIGFAIDVGGRTSHIVIMAESLEIPAVVGLKSVSQHISPGDLLIIDGNEGVVHVNPESEIIRQYRQKKRELEEVRIELTKLRDLSAETKGGINVDIAINIEAVDECAAVEQYGANGIGLYRTEYLYINRTSLPTDELIYDNIYSVAEKVYPEPVVVRTLDLGADKVAEHLGIKYGENPFAGLRGIRLCLSYPNIFKTQLKGILKASKLGNVMIMYPMITSVKEIRSANYILNEVIEELEREGAKYDPDMRVGVMVETPAAALDIDNISSEVDFVSIGTNDLIQYTLAVDRVCESVSYLYNPADISVLKLISSIIQGSQRNGKEVSMCGEMAGDTLYTELLLGMGLRKYSMSGIAVPKVKQIIRSVTISEAEHLASHVMSSRETAEISSILHKRKEELKEKIVSK